MRHALRSRTFWISFLSTVLVLTLFLAMLAVDSVGRQMSFNDVSAPFEVRFAADETASLIVNAFSWHAAFDITPIVRVLRFLGEFFCLI